MKKLMFVAAVAAAMTGVCEVSSQNVVGYVTKTINYKNNLGASPMLQIGAKVGKSISINAIKPVVAEGNELAGGDVQLKTLKANGTINKTYGFYPAAEAYWMDGIEEDGWFLDDEIRTVGDDEVIFDEGDGFILYTEMEDGVVSFTFAGEVANGATTYQIGYKNNLQGNVTAVKIDMNQVKVGDELDTLNNPVVSENLAGGDIQIKTWKANGTIGKTYGFYPAAEAKWMDDIEEDGWFLDDEIRCVDEDKVEFNPGDGFVVYTELDEAYVQLPSAL